ncbi:ABC transporter ATP-binding protein [Streptomyces sp. Z26]|uniref:ABC transporter ATP-binding protein n=1 Tax=Streptomyces sp. Z26 TaxID=2500177 RepID=UPI000EF16995|nr:ABC transporter ATP-binding protein [Streptomyces sp. Z26]RLL67239.1 ABC transporter ATP-binding protein [Streptomyces sp. Z26]
MNLGKDDRMMSAVSAAELAPKTYAWEIRATGLKVRAGRGKMAVDGLDLTLGTGVHGLLGPNGAGKTTLIRALATVLRPAGGELELFGRHVGGAGAAGKRGGGSGAGHRSGSGRHRELRRRIGYLPQEFGYYKRFTVREFVEYMAWLKEVPKKDVPAAVQRAVERVGLADRADARMKTLSGGMVRRAGIAQAIVNDPSVLLLDEPTVGLDPGQRLRFRELLVQLGADTCVVVSTHLVEDVAAACTDVALVADGRLVFTGTPDDLAEAGSPDHVGDTPLERGYSALLHDPAQERSAW